MGNANDWARRYCTSHINYEDRQANIGVARFIKKTQKTPRGAIQTATNRLERINIEKL
jgi:hypothetical protein